MGLQLQIGANLTSGRVGFRGVSVELIEVVLFLLAALQQVNLD